MVGTALLRILHTVYVNALHTKPIESHERTAYYVNVNLDWSQFTMYNEYTLTLCSSSAVLCLDLTPLIEILGSAMAETRTGIVCSGTVSLLPSQLQKIRMNHQQDVIT